MGELSTNFGELADEYASVPRSIKELVHTLEGITESIEASLGGKVAAADTFVDSFKAFESAVMTFDTEANRFLAMLREDRIPEELGEIEVFHDAALSLIEAANALRDDAVAFSEVAMQLEIGDVAEALQTLSESLADLEPSIRNSFIDNHLISAVKSYYFPRQISESDITRVVETIDSGSADHRQNAYFVLALTAETNPAPVVPHSERLADRITTGTPAEQSNLLGVLYLLQKQEQLTVDPETVLEAVDSDDPRVALHAAMILGRQSTTSEQAAAVSKRIVQLLPEASEPNIKTNATYVLYLLAKGHQDAVQDAVAPAAEFIDSEIPIVQENVIEFLGHAGAVEYTDAIAECRDQTTVEAVRVACDTALEQLETVEPDATTNMKESTSGSTILDEMDAAFRET